MARPKPSLDEMKKVLEFSESENHFVWKKNIGKGRSGIAGSLQNTGYWLIRFCKVSMLEHHVVWLFAHGVWPTQLDHIDGNRLNNAISNLRIATASQNCANTKLSSANKSGFKGVVKWKCGFAAYITKDYKSIYLGTFPTPIEAHQAYMEAARHLQGEFARAA